MSYISSSSKASSGYTNTHRRNAFEALTGETAPDRLTSSRSARPASRLSEELRSHRGWSSASRNRPINDSYDDNDSVLPDESASNVGSRHTRPRSSHHSSRHGSEASSHSSRESQRTLRRSPSAHSSRSNGSSRTHSPPRSSRSRHDADSGSEYSSRSSFDDVDLGHNLSGLRIDAESDSGIPRASSFLKPFPNPPSISRSSSTTRSHSSSASSIRSGSSRAPSQTISSSRSHPPSSFDRFGGTPLIPVTSQSGSGRGSDSGSNASSSRSQHSQPHSISRSHSLGGSVNGSVTGSGSSRGSKVPSSHSHSHSRVDSHSREPPATYHSSPGSSLGRSASVRQAPSVSTDFSSLYDDASRSPEAQEFPQRGRRMSTNDADGNAWRLGRRPEDGRLLVERSRSSRGGSGRPVIRDKHGREIPRWLLWAAGV